MDPTLSKDSNQLPLMTQAEGQAAFTTADANATRRIMQLGAEHLGSCYQCGTCSVVCPLTPDDQAFPRKEMVWAQWGLKDKLLQDGDVWLCHQCNECSTHCPRDAMPGDLMAAVRTYQIEHYAVPNILGKVISNPKNLPLAFIPPLLLTTFLVLFAVIIPEGGLEFPDRDALIAKSGKAILFEEFIGHIYIDIFSVIAVGFAVVVAWIGGQRFWKGIRQSEVNPQTVREGFAKSLLLSLVDIANHTYFKMCKVNKPRGYAHMGILYGFLFLLAATTLAFIWTTGLGKELSLPVWHPIKIIGNVGGAALLVGLTWVVWRRLARRPESGRSVYFDWYFIGILYLVTITGFVVELVRYGDLRVASYSLYMVHLVFYFMLFTYLPFTKFAHIIYRTLALTHARQIGRKPATRHME